MAAPKKKPAQKQAAKDPMDFINDAEDTLEGFQDVNAQTMAIPFIRVLQSLSPQLNKQDPAYIEGAEEGDWFNTVKKEVYGKSVGVIPLKFERIYIEWQPNRGGLVDYHSPDHAAIVAVDKTFGKWKTEDGNDLQENYVYFCLIDGHEEDGIAILSFSSSMIKMAREWNRLYTTHRMDNGQIAKPYYIVWDLTTEYRQNDQGNWYTPVVSFRKYINQKQYEILAPNRKALPSARPDFNQLVDQTEDADEEASASY